MPTHQSDTSALSGWGRDGGDKRWVKTSRILFQWGPFHRKQEARRKEVAFPIFRDLFLNS